MRTINGFQIREALSRWRARLKVADGQFKDSIWAFADETWKLHPDEVMNEFTSADAAICALEVAQQKYNELVRSNIGSETFSMSLLVKMVGGAGRTAAHWRLAATDSGKEGRYYQRTNERDKDTIQANRRINMADAAKLAEKADKRASAIRAAIARGNATEITVGSGVGEVEIDLTLIDD